MATLERHLFFCKCWSVSEMSRRYPQNREEKKQRCLNKNTFSKAEISKSCSFDSAIKKMSEWEN